ncbi:MAG: sigma-54-dependent Fis family transcriptional regulator [Bacillota bacterium]
MDLMKIASNAQSIADAIASVIKVDVTIIDRHLNRIAGTGRYSSSIGMKVTTNTVFGFAMEKGESFIIENPRNHDACRQCDDKQGCKEYAQVCCPIKVNDEILGAIGLIAFDEIQKHAILHNQENLMEFLNKMADLIASKLQDQEKNERIKILAKELEIVLDAIDKGIVAVDESGKITHYNAKAAELFRFDRQKETLLIDKYLKDVNGMHGLIHNGIIRNREFSYKDGPHSVRGFYNAAPIIIGDKSLGLVFSFSNFTEVLNVVNEIAMGENVTSFDSIIGKSICLQNVKEKAQKAAKSISTVLIQGESGTGKELFARAIHFHSSRSKGPFIPINCAAIPEQLLESELFGYEEGAFTGSKRGGKAGKFELANKGTIFLDEIGDMPIHLQTKLLRVLQENMIEKIGGKEPIPIDVRVIAATNKNLEQKVTEGEFRKDLFYRLNVIPLWVPPLRDRKEDIVILVERLLEKCNRKLNKHIDHIARDVLNDLMNYQWPGNVRELENTIEYAVNMCNGAMIEKEDLPTRFKFAHHDDQKKEETASITPMKLLEKNEIIKALNHYGKSKQAVERAADALGIGRATLYRKLKEYDIQ